MYYVYTIQCRAYSQIFSTVFRTVSSLKSMILFATISNANKIITALFTTIYFTDLFYDRESFFSFSFERVKIYLVTQMNNGDL